MRTSLEPKVGPGTSVREILTRYPSAEVVFERHGLLGCGGPNGPREPVGFFARVHQVDPNVLITELNAHIAEHPPDEKPGPTSKPPTVVYPIFLVASLTIAILAGFTTGIVALTSGALGWVIPGINWLLLVQTHGRLQLYGWAGLFVFGVAYHVVPRFVAAPIAFPRLSQWTFVLTVAGLAVSVGQMITTGDLQILHLVFSAGLVLLALAAMTYALVSFATVRASEQPIELPIIFMLTGAFWLILGTTLEAAVAELSQPGQPIQPAMEEPALEAVLEGFLVVTALGVSLRTLPVFAGLARTHRRAMWPTYIAVQAALVTLVAGAAIAGDFDQTTTGQPIAALGALALFGAVAIYVWAIRLYEPANLPVAEMGTGRGWARAVRFAYGWLLIGLALQAVASVRAALTGAAIPWGTLGAARHAIALGFITLLIVGMASRVIPVFAGKPLWKTWLVDVATACLVGSVLLRVPTETLAPYGTSLATDLLLALSGPLALAGLLAFALNFTVTMTRRDPATVRAQTPVSDRPRRAFRGEDLLADVLRMPGGLDLLLKLGLSFLSDPGHRAIAARSLTIAQAARRGDQDPDRVLAAINHSLGVPAQPAQTVDPDQTVADILEKWPATLDVFVGHGFTPLADPELRRRLAPTITVRQAASSRGIDLERLLTNLRAAMSSRNAESTTSEGRL